VKPAGWWPRVSSTDRPSRINHIATAQQIGLASARGQNYYNLDDMMLILSGGGANSDIVSDEKVITDIENDTSYIKDKVLC
jgi:hypothetical protein